MPDGRGRRGASRRARTPALAGSVSAGPRGAAREGRDPSVRREPAPARRQIPPHRSPGTPHGWAVRDRRAAAPGQGTLVQQRPRRVGSGGDRPPAARACLRDRQAHQPVRRCGAGDAARCVARRARGRPGGRLRWCRGRHAPGGRRAGDRPDWPVPRDRGGARRSSRKPSRSSPPSRTFASSSTRASPERTTNLAPMAGFESTTSARSEPRAAPCSSARRTIPSTIRPNG